MTSQHRFHLSCSEPLLRAQALNMLGFATLPIRSGTKKPAVKWKKWIHRPPSIHEVGKLFDPPRPQSLEVAVILGHQLPDGRYLAEIDCDTEASANHFKHLVSRTIAYKGKRGAKIWLSLPFAPAPTSQKGKEYGLRGVGNYTLAPWSLHSVQEGSETRYKPLPGSKSLEFGHHALLKLTEREAKEIGFVPYTKPRISLSKNALGVLAGDKYHVKKYHSRSEAEYSAVLEMARKGMTQAQILSLFTASAALDTHFNTQNGKETTLEQKQHFIGKAYKNAVEYLLKQQTEVQKETDEMFHLALHMKWKRRYDKYVFLALLKRARDLHTLMLSSSCGELAVLLGTSKMTVNRAIKHLIEQELVKVVQKHTRITSRVFQITHLEQFKTLPVAKLLPSFSQQHYEAVGSISQNSFISSTQSDFFMGRTGKLRLEISLGLGNGSKEFNMLLETVSMSKRSLKKHLDHLVSLGVVVYSGKQYTWVGKELDKCAAKLYLRGRYQRLVQELKEKAQAWRSYLALRFIRRKAYRKPESLFDLSTGSLLKVVNLGLGTERVCLGLADR